MPRVFVLRIRKSASVHSLASVLQHYTGLTLPEAQRAVERARAGERVELELDDEYAAYDLASLLSDLGASSDVDESL
jgi:hypothetical protein